MNTLTKKLIQATKANVKRISDSIEIEQDGADYAVIRITKKDGRRFRLACTQPDGSRLLVEESEGGMLRMSGATNYIHDSVKPYLQNSLIEVIPS